MLSAILVSLVGCAATENNIESVKVYNNRVDNEAYYKASPRIQDGLKLYVSDDEFIEGSYPMKKPYYGIKILDKLVVPGGKVEIKNILTGEKGYVKINDLAPMSPSEIKPIKEDMKYFSQKIDYKTYYKASSDIQKTGLKIYDGLIDYATVSYIMKKPYGIKILEKIEDSGFKVSIKNVITGDTGYVKMRDLVPMSSKGIEGVKKELEIKRKKEKEKSARNIKAIFQFADTLNKTFYPCPKGGAHDTVHYRGIEPMGDNHYRKHYRCSKCGQYYYRTIE